MPIMKQFAGGAEACKVAAGQLRPTSSKARQMKSARENTLPRRALLEARLGHMRAIVRRGDPLQFQFWANNFQRRPRRTRPPLPGRRARAAFRIQRNMPLICPTCQMASSHASGRLLLCMGLFSIFWQRAPSKGRSPALSAVLPGNRTVRYATGARRHYAAISIT